MKKIISLIVAGMIAEHTGGELFHVETVTVYPDEYNDLIEVAKEEQDNDERPELASAVEDMDRYQTVFIGFPNWLAYHNLIQCTQA